MSETTIPPRCPSCGDRLVVVKLVCAGCGTEVTGEFDTCPVCSLEGESADLFGHFLEARGNLKEVQRRLGVSYPTVRQRMDRMFRELDGDRMPMEPGEVLRMLREGRIDVEAAERMLAGEQRG